MTRHISDFIHRVAHGVTHRFTPQRDHTSASRTEPAGLRKPAVEQTRWYAPLAGTGWKGGDFAPPPAPPLPAGGFAAAGGIAHPARQGLQPHAIPLTLAEKHTAAYTAAALVAGSHRSALENPSQDARDTAFAAAVDRAAELSDPEVAGLLKMSNEIVQLAREKLPHRGNVTTDVEQTGHQAYRKTRALRHVMQMLPDEGGPARDGGMVSAFGCGNCGDHANVVLCLLAGRMPAGQRAYIAHPRHTDHEYVVMENLQTGAILTLDSWAEDGGVLLGRDNHFLDVEPDTPMRKGTLVHGASLKARQLYSSYQAWEKRYTQDGQLRAPVLAQFDELTRLDEPSKHLFPPTEAITTDAARHLSRAVQLNPQASEFASIRSLRDQQFSVRIAASHAHTLPDSLADFVKNGQDTF